MEIKLLDKISRPLNVELPYRESLEGYLDMIIPKVRQWSEDLREINFYMGKPWLEVRDDEGFHNMILHYFNDEGEYLKSVDGDFSTGSWRLLQGNKFLLGDNKGELYDLAFLDSQFFILKKHGDHPGKKYFFLVVEGRGKGLEWRDLVELLFNKYRDSNSSYVVFALIILVIIAIILVLSFA